MTEPTDPTTADAAAEHVQAFLNARREIGDTRMTIAFVEPDPCTIPARMVRLIEPDLRALLAERARMAAELEQVRAAKAANLSDYDVALLAVHEVRDYWQAQAVVEWERAEQLRDATLEAAELLHRLSGPGPCDYDGDGACRGHDGFAGGYLEPCPHPAGRRFVEAWGTGQSPATDGPDREGAQKGPESHGDGRSVDGAPQRTWTTLEAPQGPSGADGVPCRALIPLDVAGRIRVDPSTMCALLAGHADPTHDDGNGLSWQGLPVPPGTPRVCCGGAPRCVCCGGPR